MDISVKGKNMDVGTALTGHVEEQMQDVVGKYFSQAIDAATTFTKESGQICVDISVHPGPRGLVIQGSSKAQDAYAGFDVALERIAKQLRRYKRRLNNHHKNRNHDDLLPAQQYVLQPEHEENEATEDGGPIIIAEMPTGLATLTVSEAVMRMDLADSAIIMFRNHANGVMNVVYRREDGNIGWIDPAEAN